MIKFYNKETYLAYRSAWKSEYAKLSKEIRNTKYFNWYNSLGQTRLDSLPYSETVKYNSLSNETIYGNWGLINAKKTATTMLKELADAKVEAQRQYLAQKEAEKNTVAAK